MLGALDCCIDLAEDRVAQSVAGGRVEVAAKVVTKRLAELLAAQGLGDGDGGDADMDTKEAHDGVPFWVWVCVAS